MSIGWQNPASGLVSRIEPGGAALCIHGRQLTLCGECVVKAERLYLAGKKAWAK